MTRHCTAVLADLNVFRRLEPDSGTALEVGMAVELSKPVWTYFAPVSSLRKLVEHDVQGFPVEDFGLPRNLMMAVPGPVPAQRLNLGAEALAAFLISLETCGLQLIDMPILGAEHRCDISRPSQPYWPLFHIDQQTGAFKRCQ